MWCLKKLNKPENKLLLWILIKIDKIVDNSMNVFINNLQVWSYAWRLCRK